MPEPFTTTPTRPQPVKMLLTSREAAAALSVCEKTLWSITAPRGPLPVVKIGRAVRYSVTDLEAFIKCQKAASAPCGAPSDSENSQNTGNFADSSGLPGTNGGGA